MVLSQTVIEQAHAVLKSYEDHPEIAAAVATAPMSRSEAEEIVAEANLNKQDRETTRKHMQGGQRRGLDLEFLETLWQNDSEDLEVLYSQWTKAASAASKSTLPTTNASKMEARKVSKRTRRL